jgi:hypothetical protein
MQAMTLNTIDLCVLAGHRLSRLPIGLSQFESW